MPLHTIELGLGKDTSTDRKTILPIADIKGRDGRMVGNLAEEREKDREQNERDVMYTAIYSDTWDESCLVY